MGRPLTPGRLMTGWQSKWPFLASCFGSKSLWKAGMGHCVFPNPGSDRDPCLPRFSMTRPSGSQEGSREGPTCGPEVAWYPRPLVCDILSPPEGHAYHCMVAAAASGLVSAWETGLPPPHPRCGQWAHSTLASVGPGPFCSGPCVFIPAPPSCPAPLMNSTGLLLSVRSRLEHRGKT